ncbi:MAG: acyltransferase [Burkholderiales bacterium]
MFRRLPPLARGVIAALLLGLNTLFWCSALFAAALVKLVVPAERARATIDHVLNAIATRWIAGNSAWMGATQATAWDVVGIDRLDYGGWYLVTSNHQSWVDILVLQHLLNRRIPLLKFFLKRQLIYVPVMGLAWWALEFPFMRRHSAAALAKRPELRQQDVNVARRACEKFARVPTSVMNFVEGTRFTPAKHAAQESPYRHLLKPKAGAMALALEVLGSRFDALLDVTIVYPDGVPTFWEFMCGRVPRIVVRAQRVPIPPEIASGDYTNDPAYRKRFQQWLEVLWQDKDALVETLLQDASPCMRDRPPLPSRAPRDRTPA